MGGSVLGRAPVQDFTWTWAWPLVRTLVLEPRPPPTRPASGAPGPGAWGSAVSSEGVRRRILQCGDVLPHTQGGWRRGWRGDCRSTPGPARAAGGQRCGAPGVACAAAVFPLDGRSGPRSTARSPGHWQGPRPSVPVPPPSGAAPAAVARAPRLSLLVLVEFSVTGSIPDAPGGPPPRVRVGAGDRRVGSGPSLGACEPRHWGRRGVCAGPCPPPASLQPGSATVHSRWPERPAPAPCCVGFYGEKTTRASAARRRGRRQEATQTGGRGWRGLRFLAGKRVKVSCSPRAAWKAWPGRLLLRERDGPGDPPRGTCRRQGGGQPPGPRPAGGRAGGAEQAAWCPLPLRTHLPWDHTSPGPCPASWLGTGHPALRAGYRRRYGGHAPRWRASAEKSPGCGLPCPSCRTGRTHAGLCEAVLVVGA